ncbi:MAG TPA: MFS transporter [Oscillatoriales cyanobacterium M59_W2019_021]|nr:MFS transporter [Oscillatoriales cyanobacterium M4454_W2019_049]HIK53201.1 MFS transporter [Oscillatoriales cyanobacterium M59_W2019_021]
MELKNWQLNRGGIGQKVLQWVNLRPEESERTLLMFAFYTATSIGLLWLEAIAVGLFIDRYGAESIPLIYVAGAGIGSGLGFLYSWLQTIVPLRRSIVWIAILMAIPLLFFRVGLTLTSLFAVTVFVMRLWVEGVYVLNDLNTSITANQLFNIREIKRTYPLISSGILVADVLSGFSLPFLLERFGLQNMLIGSAVMLAVGAAILFYLSENYKQAFPDSNLRSLDDERTEYTSRRIQGPLQNYVRPLVAFFILVEVLYVLIDFQFVIELERNLTGEDTASTIASFIALFNGVLGIFELLVQWFASSRVVERLGVFVAGAILPTLVALLGIASIVGSIGGWFPIFFGILAVKFIDELFHYTLIEGTGPVLFQPLPETQRNNVQALVNGVAEPVSTGVTGVAILAITWVGQRWVGQENWQPIQSQLFVWLIVLGAFAWIAMVVLMRSRYVGLLVSSAERGRLGVSDVDLRILKRSVVETLEQPGSEADKRSCIELLCQIDPQNVGEAIAPLLENLPPSLQRQSLEAMIEYPKAEYVATVRSLIERPLPPEVLALALRYIWLTEQAPDVSALRAYLRPEVDPVVRGTAAALILRRGSREQKAEATNTLRRMLSHKQERERVMGTRALGEAEYLQALRLFVPNLLQDESLRVRCSLLDAIASAQLEQYYPSLLRGLYYKSTREAAMRAIVRLGNEVLDRTLALAEDIHKPDLVRMYAWSAIGQIGTAEAIDALVAHLMTAWGANRRNILRVLLKIPNEKGIEGVLDRLGRSGVEMTIDQELMFLGQIYAALVDLEKVATEFEDFTGSLAMADGKVKLELDLDRAVELLRRSLHDLQTDVWERLFLLMKFLYPLSSIQAAAFNLKSESRSNMARGLEILDNVIDIPSKRALLSVLDRQSDGEKLQNLSDLIEYRPMSPSDRLRHLLELRHFLSDWSLACCFHLARVARWSLSGEQTLAGLRYPKGFVREAVLAYLEVASPRALVELLPRLQHDPDRLVAAQVQQMMAHLGSNPSTV